MKVVTDAFKGLGGEGTLVELPPESVPPVKQDLDKIEVKNDLVEQMVSTALFQCPHCHQLLQLINKTLVTTVR